MAPEPTLAVLYCDDDPLNLRVFEANFRHRFAVVTCNSGEQALELILQKPGAIGVLLSDQRMPEMTGVELLEKVREVAPDIQRMVITAYSDVQSVMSAVNRGQVARYFIKPWDREELTFALEDSLRIFSLQQRLRDIEVRMMRSERLAAIGEVAAGVAHEMMNPIAYISQNITSLRGELKTLVDYIVPVLEQRPSAEVSHVLVDLPSLLQDVETGAQHLREVAFNIRTQARGEELDHQCDVAEVAGFALKLTRSTLRHRIHLAARGPSAQVRCGPVKLTQVLTNLVVNAIHALDGRESGGTIDLSWTVLEGSKVLLQVEDNGSGIPPELMDKVFEPLFTTKAAGVGTGLGLGICRQLMREMGGEMSLRSRVGVGTTVQLTLPGV